jgi:hypothetical protein
MGKTHFKPLAARHGRGTAWARHAMCESAFKRPWVVIVPILMRYTPLLHGYRFTAAIMASSFAGVSALRVSDLHFRSAVFAVLFRGDAAAIVVAH